MMDLAVSTRDDIWYECTSFATQRTSSKIMWRIWPWMYSTVVKRQDKEVFDVNSLVKTLGNELQVSLCEGFDHGCTVQNIDAQSFSNSFEGGTWGWEKIWKGVLYFRVLLHFYDPIFQSLLRGYMRCPPRPPLHPCVLLWYKC